MALRKVPPDKTRDVGREPDTQKTPQDRYIAAQAGVRHPGAEEIQIEARKKETFGAALAGVSNLVVDVSQHEASKALRYVDVVRATHREEGSLPLAEKLFIYAGKNNLLNQLHEGKNNPPLSARTPSISLNAGEVTSSIQLCSLTTIIGFFRCRSPPFGILSRWIQDTWESRGITVRNFQYLRNGYFCLVFHNGEQAKRVLRNNIWTVGSWATLIPTAMVD